MTVERQTIDRVTIPGVGTGQLKWRNGPPGFVLDDGTIVEVSSVCRGGWSSTGGSWLSVRLTRPPADRATIRAVVHRSGDLHDQVWSPTFGEVWLVWTARGQVVRFERDSGEACASFEWVELAVGRPEYAAKCKRARSRMPKTIDTDERNWCTFTTRDGQVFTYRRGGPPPSAEVKP